MIDTETRMHAKPSFNQEEQNIKVLIMFNLSLNEIVVKSL